MAFENFLLAIGGHIEASDMVGDEASLTVLRVKGQRLGFSPAGHHAFAQIQKIAGVPDVGTRSHRSDCPLSNYLTYGYHAMLRHFAIGSRQVLRVRPPTRL